MRRIQILITNLFLLYPLLAVADQWSEVNPLTRPGPRESHGMAFDSHRNVTVLFGGEITGTDGLSVPYDDTWLFDGNEWIQGPAGPSARWSHAMAFDSARGETVLFGGGQGGASQSADTWLFDGQAWTLSSSIGPPPRGHHAMVFDSARSETVLFGGVLGGGPPIYGDTWLFDGNSWNEINTPGPSPRFFHAMAYDSVRNVTVLFGGWDGTQHLGDTWIFDGATWTQLSVTGPTPTARSLHRMTFDSAKQAVVLFGGNDGNDRDDTWLFDGTVWTQVNTPGPAARRGHAMAFDSLRQLTVLFGGQDGGILFFDDTWELQVTESPQIIRIDLKLNPSQVEPSNLRTGELHFSRIEVTVTDNIGQKIPNFKVLFEDQPVVPLKGHDHVNISLLRRSTFLVDRSKIIVDGTQNNDDREVNLLMQLNDEENTMDSCITDSRGTCYVDYNDPEVSGEFKITVKSADDPSIFTTSNIIVRINGLRTFQQNELGDHIEIVGGTGTINHAKCTGTVIKHPDNHYGDNTLIEDIKDIALEFYENTRKKLRVNDMSLEWGGLFDICGDWRIPHKAHRSGMNADIEFAGLLRSEREELLKIIKRETNYWPLCSGKNFHTVRSPILLEPDENCDLDN